jgi:tetratricopeptide (TPR) repeat protein
MNAAESPPRGRLAGVAGVLAALTFALYLRTAGFEFLNYDDPDYVTQNPAVADGLGAGDLAWAFGFHAANWHPLTWLAHMLDVELFGLAPGPMHLVNAGLHALNAALLFLGCASLTRRLGPSALVATLFAVHPLRVQCVAWISERKELLASALFFALLLCYARYVHGRERGKGRGAYLAALACLALGVLAKPMLVTAPCVLLLLDRWPLARATRGAWPALWREKLPFFALAAISASLTWLAQRAGGAVGELAALPLGARLASAGAGVLAYVRASVWPTDLAVFYPHPALLGQSALVPGLAGAALALVVSLLAWRLRRAAPALFTGWFWFLGMLVPVIGLVQVGDQAWADRYAYLPTIGLALALVFGVNENLERIERPGPLRTALACGAGAACLVLAAVTLRTVPHWRDSQSLFERALAVTEHNWVAHNNLGLVYLLRREHEPAREHFEAALRANPHFHKAHFNLAQALELAGDPSAAERSYRAFLATAPGHPETLARLADLARTAGEAALTSGESARALELLLHATREDPNSARAWAALARARLALSPPDLAGAQAAFERALELGPELLRVRHELGLLLLRLGQREAARAQFTAVLARRPADPQAGFALARLALEDGEPARALALLEPVLAEQPDFLPAWRTRGAAQEALGEGRAALASYERCLAPGSVLPEAASAAAWILAAGPDPTLLDGPRALALARLAGAAEDGLEALAAAHARSGDFARASELQAEALARGGPAPEREERLRLYRAGQPYLRTR